MLKNDKFKHIKLSVTGVWNDADQTISTTTIKKGAKIAYPTQLPCIKLHPQV